MTKKLTFIFQAYINVEYCSKLFRETKIIMLKKMKKKERLHFFNVYKSIVLLKTMHKILKSRMINKITELAKKNSLL